MWSLPPAVISSGPRSGFFVSTLAGELPEKLAAAASKSGRPGEGIVHLSKRSFDSSSETALPKPYLNCFSFSETAFFLLAGLRRAMLATRSADGGR